MNSEFIADFGSAKTRISSRKGEINAPVLSLGIKIRESGR